MKYTSIGLPGDYCETRPPHPTVADELLRSGTAFPSTFAFPASVSETICRTTCRYTNGTSSLYTSFIRYKTVTI